MYTGFLSVELFPSPKSHLHDVGSHVLWSVKLTVRGVFPEAGDAEKLATGAVKTNGSATSVHGVNGKPQQSVGSKEKFSIQAIKQDFNLGP